MLLSAWQVPYLVDIEQLGRISVLGPTLQFITEPLEGAPCIMRGTIPANSSVPLHSHDDPETFIPLSGVIDGLIMMDDDHAWVDIAPGSVFHVPGGALHALRNQTVHEAAMLIVSTAKLGRFFEEIGVRVREGAPPPGPPSDHEVRRFLETSARYGYWNASPDENARVGITLP